jgi:hypothetical protein
MDVNYFDRYVRPEHEKPAKKSLLYLENNDRAAELTRP